MTEAVGTVRVDLETNWAQFRDGVQRSSQALAGLGQTAARVAGAGISLIGRATAISGVAAVTFGRQSLEAARNAEEMQGAFNAAFGDMSERANAFATQFADDTGNATSTIQEQALAFQNLFAAIAPTQEVAEAASEDFTRLANDLAALKNIRPDQAISLLQRALASGGNALRQYGVDLSTTAVKNEAVRRGIITQSQTLSEQQEVFVRAQIVMDAFSGAQGALERQAGSTADSQRRLSETFREQQEQLGRGLLPLLNTLLQTFNAIIGAAQGAGNAIGSALAQSILRSDDATIRAYQLNAALHGQFLAYEEVAGALVRSRQAHDGAAAATDENSAAVVDATADLAGYGDGLADVARTLPSLTGNGGRTWAAEHRADIERLREAIDPVGESLRHYVEQMSIAQRAGLDLAGANRVLAAEAIEAGGGIDQFRAHLEELPEAFRAVLDEQLAEQLADKIKLVQHEMEAFADDLNAQFNTESNLEMRLQQIDEAFTAGLISMEVWKRARDEAMGADTEVSTAVADEVERRNRGWERTKDLLLDVAQGTRDWEEAWKSLVLQLVRAQLMEPFLQRLFTLGGGAKGGGLGGFGNIIGSFFSSLGGGGLPFGGGKADGGRVMPGMEYIVGERGREVFRPDVAGTIVPHEQAGRGTVIQNIQTPNVESFRASRRQLARDARMGMQV